MPNLSFIDEKVTVNSSSGGDSGSTSQQEASTK